MCCGVFVVGTTLRNISDTLCRYVRCTHMIMDGIGLKFVSIAKHGKIDYSVHLHLSSRDACTHRYGMRQLC